MRKACISRGSLIGDAICSLSAIKYYKENNPDFYISFLLASKCKQLSPLLRKHSLINEIYITENEESLSSKDQKFLESHDFWVNPFPSHKNENWAATPPNSIYSETLDMIAFPGNYAHDNLPLLERFWARKEKKKTVCLQSKPGYGQGTVRGPSVEWWNELLKQIHELGYITYQVGSANDPKINTKYDYTHADFLPLVKNIIDCEWYIGGDSGLSIVVSAFHEIKQINLLTDWMGNTNNPLALAPRGKKSLITDLFSPGSCDGIKHEDVLSALK